MGWVLTQQTAHLFESLQEAEATKLLRLSCRTLVSRCHAISMQTFPNPWIAKKSSASLSGPLPVLVSFFAEKVEQSGTSEALGQIPQHDLGQTNRFRPHEQRSRKNAFPRLPTCCYC